MCPQVAVVLVAFSRENGGRASSVLLVSALFFFWSFGDLPHHEGSHSQDEAHSLSLFLVVLLCMHLAGFSKTDLMFSRLACCRSVISHRSSK